MSADFDGAVEQLLALWPALLLLIGEPDDDGTGGRGLNRVSSPPWNPEVAAVLMRIHFGARRWEARLYAENTGSQRTPRGGSDGNTVAALRGMAANASQLGRVPSSSDALKDVEWWLEHARQLPAVDEQPRWRVIRLGPNCRACSRPPGGEAPRCAKCPPETIPLCPFCETPSLRVAERSVTVRCFFTGGHPSWPGPGPRPTARLDIGRVSMMPQLVWDNGLVQYQP